MIHDQTKGYSPVRVELAGGDAVTSSERVILPCHFVAIGNVLIAGDTEFCAGEVEGKLHCGLEGSSPDSAR